MLLAPYPLGVGFDEMFADDGRPRASGERFVRRLETLASGNLQQRQKTAELHLQNMGITFNVYSHEAGTEKVWPFDLLPRIIDATEWSMIERGLEQRIRALNLFIDDIYNDLKIIKDKAVPESLIGSSKTLRRQCVGFHPPENVWCHITGVDLVRNADGTLYVLEDNMRCPSGVQFGLFRAFLFGSADGHRTGARKRPRSA